MNQATGFRNSRSRESTSQVGRVVLMLREMILRGDFHARERIAEVTVASLLRASRTPVRLALDRLAHEGLLEPLRTGGFRVREFTLTDIWDAIELRGVLEGTAARLAAERLSGPAEALRLRETCNLLEGVFPTELQDYVRYFELNEAFHREIWGLAKSPILLRMIESVARLPFASPSAMVFGSVEPGERKIVAEIGIRHHRALVEAIESREGSRAEGLAREHSRAAKANLIDALRHGESFKRVPGASLVRMPHHPGETMPEVTRSATHHKVTHETNKEHP